ncbi:hypothetical protein WKH86_12890 [Xanthomonas oryzae pv. oryzae]|uniref:Membrane protein n=5 Tax=Xanthomonas oryzae TaxID=347 RepID=A0A854CLQ0_XANOO|nr:hypothetical protein [Xanthomonas oryzae]AJQ82099.1 membrane protein [Xanthomonas oryzae pv. oryzae PXO86]AKK63006.1 membrane protein [Xanthomonas oryzae pv. oryzicola]AKN92362.1 membrane protein [Xanthomonas oryzae pv. oryzicola]AKN96098.1 membrane protein [Xanthomonas oryzae pv. oryzicola]AKO01853.1 membrane protein [Xanthomonas oryzae pv. oryzicola]
MTPRSHDTLILSLLAVSMAATRINHFAPVPDASWAVFFIGGFHLAARTRLAFPLLMLLAVAVDWLVITRQGMSFWQHYCVSPAYWCLIPAYFALWAGGVWLRRHYRGAQWSALARLLPALLIAVALCQLIAQGSFYWISASVAEPTVAGWFKNYTDWLGPYLRSAALYVAAAAVIQVAAERLAAPRRQPHTG